MRKITLMLIALIMITFCYSENRQERRLVTFSTNYGDIELELYPAIAPNLTAHFLELSREQFYTGTYFHYVDKDFMIAGGDPNTKETGIAEGRTEIANNLKDEICAKALGLDTLLVRQSFLGEHLPNNSPALNWTMKRFLESQGYTFQDGLASLPNNYGYLSMASNKPNSNSSRFFIITSGEGASWLNGKNTVIGKVRKGMDIVHKIESLPHDNNLNPLPEHRAVILQTTVE